MQITFTLSPSYTGATYVAGPFNISGTTSAGTPYWLVTGVTKSELATGHTITTPYETLTGGTIASTGTCSTTQNWYVTTPSPTPSPTATDSGQTLYTLSAQGAFGVCTDACAAFNSSPSYTTFYMTTQTFNELSAVNGTLYTQNIANPSYIANAGFYYHTSGYMFVVNPDGTVSSTIYLCQQNNACGAGNQN